MTQASRSEQSAFSLGDGGLLVTLAVMWGFSFLFIKVAVEEVSPLWLVAVRTFVGALALFAIVALGRRPLPRDGWVWWHLFVLAAASNVVPWAMVAWAEQHIPSGLSSVLNTLVPATTLLVAALAGLERLTARKIAGLVLAMGGTLVVIGGEFGGPDRVTAVLVNVAATFFFAGGAVYAKRYVSGRVPATVVAAGQVGLGFIIALPSAWIVGPVPEWASLGPEVWGSMAALGVFGTGVAFYVFYSLVERVGATNTTLVTYLIPVVGLLAGWLVLDESFGMHVIGGGLVIVAGIWLAQRRSRVADRPGEEGTSPAAPGGEAAS